ncbi:MAG: hypothetical protein EU529_06560 [Promethearchaeota archaeon]|nr:MAG: hypothetical protein EU529_06560 [Candidatus Lokiarchaeota archaeon]
MPSPNFEVKKKWRYQSTYPKLKKLRAIINQQLQEYSRSGKRLYQTFEAGLNAGIKSTTTMKKYSIHILTNIFRSPIKANVIYDMIFGKAITSYHDLVRKCKKADLKLKTTPTNWFEILKLRKTKSIQDLKIKVKYMCGHENKKSIQNIGKRGCNICRLDNALNNLKEAINFDDVLELSKSRNLKLLSSENEFKQAKKNAKRKSGKNTDAELRWKCKRCGEKFLKRYSYIAYKDSACPNCNIFKNQLITQKICRYIFSDCIVSENFITEHPIYKIFADIKLPKILSHFNVHVDLFAILKINNRLIRLAIEYQGAQHENSNDGWLAFLGITHGKGSHLDWRKLIRRDKEKVLLFEQYNRKDYYLIVVPYHIKKDERFQYIIKEFTNQTGIKIKKKKISWRDLYYNDGILKFT